MELKVRKYGDDWYACPDQDTDEFDAKIRVTDGVGQVFITVGIAYEQTSQLIGERVTVEYETVDGGGEGAWDPLTAG